MWKRIKFLEKRENLVTYPGMASLMIFHAKEVTKEIRRIKRYADQNLETLDQATHLFERLQKLSIAFFDLFFLSMKCDVNI